MWMETVKFAHVISTRKADKHRVCLLCPVYSRRAIIRGQRGNHSIKHSGGWGRHGLISHVSSCVMTSTISTLEDRMIIPP